MFFSLFVLRNSTASTPRRSSFHCSYPQIVPPQSPFTPLHTLHLAPDRSHLSLTLSSASFFAFFAFFSPPSPRESSSAPRWLRLGSMSSLINILTVDFLFLDHQVVFWSTEYWVYFLLVALTHVLSLLSFAFLVTAAPLSSSSLPGGDAVTHVCHRNL